MNWRMWLVLGLLSGCTAEGGLDKTKNTPPVANAGPDVLVQQNEVVALSGHRSVDLDGDPLTYRWTLSAPTGSGARLSNTNGVETQFTADAAGEYQVTLVVSDGIEDSPIDTLVVKASPVVGPVNQQPVANAGNDANVQKGATVQLDGTGSSDADGDPLTFEWTLEQKPAGSNAVLSSDRAPRPAFVADLDGKYRIKLVVSDGLVDSEADYIEITAFASNTPPIANAGPDQMVALGSRVQLDGTTSFDADGDELFYTWTLTSKPAGSVAAMSDMAVAKPDITLDVEGAYVVELVVSDGEVASASDAVTLTATKNNLQPVAHAGTNAVVPVGEVVVLDGSQSYDANDDALTYAWVWVNKPATSMAEFSDAVAMAPTFTPDVEGDYIAQLTVSDGTLESTPDSVTVTASLANVPPVAAAGMDQAVRTGTVVSLDAGASSDADNDSLTYVWTFTGRPVGSMAALMGANTATPTFTPDVDGTYVVQLVVNDGRVDSAADSMVVTASTPALPAPAIEGDVVISEMMIDPIDDATQEWFEIYNPTSTRWDLKNCTLTDLGSNLQVIGSNLEIGPGEYRTLARTLNPGFSPDYVYGSGFQLANTEDEIILTCNNAEIAQVAYSKSGGFPITANVSLQVSVDLYDEQLNDDPAAWCVGTMVYQTVGMSTNSGTPGTANAVCQ